MAYRYAYDPGVTSLSMTSISLVLLGYPERARHEIQATLTLARQLSHPFSLSFALGSLAIGYQFLREDGAAREKAETLMALADKHTFPLWSAIGIILHGWTLVEQGQEEEGIGRLCKGLSDRRAMRAAAGQTYYLSLLAGAYEKRERSEEGLAVLAEALEIGRKHQESVCEAELHRLKGELILQQSKASPRQDSDKSQPGQRQSHAPNPQAVTEAEACFFKAITIARGQRAKWWELRATVSLARLWQQQGKKQQAHEMLAAVYHWFTEGFDTKDLQEARALLEELRD
jgi:predicted ATPase